MVLIMFVVIFLLTYILPGDPAQAMLPDGAPEEAIQSLRHELGLDKPIYQQFVDYTIDILRLDLGQSWYRKSRVIDDIRGTMPATIELTIVAISVSILIGLAGGIISALKKDRIPDHLIRLGSMFFQSVPLFWIGPLMQLFFGVYLKILPVSGRIDPLLEPPTVTGFVILDSVLAGNLVALFNAVGHLIMPGIALGLFSSCVISRISRSEIIEALSQDYVLTARAKGLKETVVVYKHALRNALVPVITVIGLQFALMLGGAVMTETIFNIYGMGSLLFYALHWRDFMLIRGLLIFSAIWVGIVTYIIDIVYCIIDPRIRY